jgi:hypothetical protein
MGATGCLPATSKDFCLSLKAYVLLGHIRPSPSILSKPSFRQHEGKWCESAFTEVSCIIKVRATNRFTLAPSGTVDSRGIC